ncbi:MAG: hypothetical protein AAF320_06900 [Myxococcota bacterium]
MRKNNFLILSILQASIVFFSGCSEEKAYADKVITELSENLAKSEAHQVFGSDFTESANLGEESDVRSMTRKLYAQIREAVPLHLKPVNSSSWTNDKYLEYTFDGSINLGQTIQDHIDNFCKEATKAIRLGEFEGADTQGLSMGLLVTCRDTLAFGIWVNLKGDALIRWAEVPSPRGSNLLAFFKPTLLDKSPKNFTSFIRGKEGESYITEPEEQELVFENWLSELSNEKEFITGYARFQPDLGTSSIALENSKLLTELKKHRQPKKQKNGQPVQQQQPGQTGGPTMLANNYNPNNPRQPGQNRNIHTNTTTHTAPTIDAEAERIRKRNEVLDKIGQTGATVLNWLQNKTSRLVLIALKTQLASLEKQVATQKLNDSLLDAAAWQTILRGIITQIDNDMPSKLNRLRKNTRNLLQVARDALDFWVMELNKPQYATL